MSLVSLFPLLFASILISSSPATAFNVTKILNDHSDYTKFNDYLSQTGVAGMINSRQTITVLAVSNSGMSALSGRSTDFIKKVMTLHTILDYYDKNKLTSLKNKTALVTTLFQSTGMATGKTGFLNVTDTSDGGVMIKSPNSDSTSSLVSSVASQPYNISILQISNLVVPANLGSSPPAPAPKSAAAPNPSHAHSPKAKSPSSDTPVGSPPMPDNADTPAADAPTVDDSSAAKPIISVALTVFMITLSSIWL